MANERIAGLIADALRNGIIWPGDPDNGVKPKLLKLPVFAPAPGQPQEMVDLINSTTTMLSEAIVHTIELEKIELVEAERMDVVRTNEQREDGVWEGRPLPVHCRCDHDFTDPLMYLTVKGSTRIVVDGRALLTALQKRDPQHPHKRIEPRHESGPVDDQDPDQEESAFTPPASWTPPALDMGGLRPGQQ